MYTYDKQGLYAESTVMDIQEIQYKIWKSKKKYFFNRLFYTCLRIELYMC